MSFGANYCHLTDSTWEPKTSGTCVLGICISWYDVFGIVRKKRPMKVKNFYLLHIKAPKNKEIFLISLWQLSLIIQMKLSRKWMKFCLIFQFFFKYSKTLANSNNRTCWQSDVISFVFSTYLFSCFCSFFFFAPTLYLARMSFSHLWSRK